MDVEAFGVVNGSASVGADYKAIATATSAVTMPMPPPPPPPTRRQHRRCRATSRTPLRRRYQHFQCSLEVLNMGTQVAQ